VNAAAGKLVVQLLNQDSDGRGNVKVTNFVDRVDPEALPGKAVNPHVAPVNPGAAVVLDGYLGTTNGQLLLSDVSFNKATGKYSADLRVKNVGNTVLSRNLAVLLSELPAGVTVANASGIHAAGSAYLNFATAIQAGGLAAGTISGTIRVEINDPNLKAFGFKPVVLQGAAEPIPDLSTLRTLTVKVGDKLDFALDPNLELSIAAIGNLPTGSITGDSHLVFKPAPNQVGTYDFTLIARNGSTETRQAVTLNVVADPITTTRVTGIVANTNQAGIAGVLVEFAGQQATTDSTGKFVIVVPDGAGGDTLKVYGQRIQGGSVIYPFIAEKMPILLGHDLYQGVNNGIDRPIYLPTIDLSTGTTINPNTQTIATNPNLSGAQVAVDANSLYDKNGNAFAGVLTITEVPANLTPAALPSDLHPDLVVTIQPGDMVFNIPAMLTLPNLAGYLPGLIMDLWSINPNTGSFEIVGKGQVSANGSVIETIEGGIRNSSWHFFGPPGKFRPINNRNHDPNRDRCELNNSYKSEASAFSGAVSDDRALITYQSQGVSRGVVLHYDSLRANPNEIIHVSGEFSNIFAETDKFTAKVTLAANGVNQTVGGSSSIQVSGLNNGERIWSIPGGNSGSERVIDTATQVDISHLMSGQYQYQVEAGVKGIRTWFNSNREIVAGVVGTSTIYQNKIVVVNDSNSIFGSGWNISGLQKIVIDKDQSVLLIDGNGSQNIFSPVTVLGDFTGSIRTYKSAIGDYSQLTRQVDGTFQRRMKDGTVYNFDTQGLMNLMTDRVGNITRHIYNEVGQIQKVIDPKGLTTVFNYSGNRVTSIIDPAGRVTKLEYDQQGNLISVIDPDASKNQYGYDSRHLLTVSIDKYGNRKTGVYDEFGRAESATREDGSIVQINPVEVQGLSSKTEVISLGELPSVKYLETKPLSTYVDGNGSFINSELNNKGHIIRSTDTIGVINTNVFDNAGNIISTTDAKGNIVNYTYDSKGNILTIRDDALININEFGNTKLPTLITTPAPGVPGSLATGDINNDGYIDIVTSADNGYLSILFGDAQGLFTNTSTINISPFTQSSIINQLELRDVNNDGKLDLIANLPIDGQSGGGSSSLLAAASLLQDPVLVFLNEGGGQFAVAKVLPLLAKSDGFVTGDFNGDGKVDILVRSDIYSSQANSVYPLVLWAGDGNGNFAEQQIRINGISDTSSFSLGLQMAAIDTNGDGKTELVLNLTDRLSVYGYDSTGFWREIYSNNSNFDNQRSKFTVGDINNDGKLDIITAGSQLIEILFGQDNNVFLSQVTTM
jgi:YD repeat-containing protein